MDEKGPHRVLVVDDDEDIRHSLAQLLEEEVQGAFVSVAAHAEEALALIAQGPFDLIISDAHMSGTDGLRFLQDARRVQPAVQAVLLTASPDPLLTARAARQVGVVLANPMDLDYLVGIVQAASVGRIRRGGSAPASGTPPVAARVADAVAGTHAANPIDGPMDRDGADA